MVQIKTFQLFIRVCWFFFQHNMDVELVMFHMTQLQLWLVWLVPVALWLQSEPITFSCCTRLGPHFSFIHPGWWWWSSGRAAFPTLAALPSYFILSAALPPQRGSLSEQNFKMRLDAQWNIREEIQRYWEQRETVCTPRRYAPVHVDTHRQAAFRFLGGFFLFFFFAVSTKSLLQKGESGQKTGSLITLSSNLILIFRRCKGAPWKREAAVGTKQDDEWKMRDKMKWMKGTERDREGV